MWTSKRGNCDNLTKTQGSCQASEVIKANKKAALDIK